MLSTCTKRVRHVVSFINFSDFFPPFFRRERACESDACLHPTTRYYRTNLSPNLTSDMFVRARIHSFIISLIDDRTVERAHDLAIGRLDVRAVLVVEGAAADLRRVARCVRVGAEDPRNCGGLQGACRQARPTVVAPHSSAS